MYCDLGSTVLIYKSLFRTVKDGFPLSRDLNLESSATGDLAFISVDYQLEWPLSGM